jgi:hypothetical protein
MIFEVIALVTMKSTIFCVVILRTVQDRNLESCEEFRESESLNTW